MSEPDLREQLIADGLLPEHADAVVAHLAAQAPATAVFGAGAIYGHELAEIRGRIDAGNATNDDARRLADEVERLTIIVGWEVNEPDVRAALRAARGRHHPE